MARKPRVHLPGGVYHVILRGNGGQALFFAESDRTVFLDLLADGVARFGHRVHGFCLMTNHVHLVLQAGAAPLGRAVQNLSFRYARHANRAAGRQGHLFQGRYQARLVDSETYLLALMRYVHLNPPRAGLVKHPGDYPWSSHRAYQEASCPDWLTRDWVLSHFAKRAAVARRRFAAFVDADWRHLSEREAALSDARDPILGDDRFIERALGDVRGSADQHRPAPSMDRLVAAAAAHHGLSATALGTPGRGRRAAEARAVAAYLAQDCGAGSLTRLAERFNRDVSTLSRARNRVERRLAREPALRRTLDELRNAIMQA